MLDIDIDDVFSDLEERDARELEFVALLAPLIPSCTFQLQTRSGGVFSSDPSVVSPLNLSAVALENVSHDKGVVVEVEEGTVCVIDVERLGGLLLCWKVKNGRWWCDQIIAELIPGIVLHACLKMEVNDVRTENDQLSRQIGVLKKQHLELVENNHRQYKQIQEKERDYAKNLESEIAARTTELRKANDELIEASRLKSEFLANMSHELRTPMNAIIGFSDLLSETLLTQEQAEFAKTIKQSGDGLLVLINDILDFAKIEAGKLDIAAEPFLLADVVENVTAMFLKPAKEKNIHLHYELEPGIPARVIGDGSRLKQVLVNLTGNAMKFTAKGEVGVTVSLVRTEERACRLRFLVSDTGIGIPASKQAAIFEKFTQADGSISRNYGGTGLGLAISCQLVELMGGNVFLCSDEGKGSTFGFTVKLGVSPGLEEKFAQKRSTALEESDTTLAQTQNPQEREAIATPHNLRVLLVEDNLVNQKLASILVKREGCDVDIAGDGLVALKKLETTRYDLILMDIQMPNMDGLEATRRIRAIEGSDDERVCYLGLSGTKDAVTIVGLSAHARKEDEVQALGVGMNAFLTKPIVRGKLVALLGSLKRE